MSCSHDLMVEHHLSSCPDCDQDASEALDSERAAHEQTKASLAVESRQHGLKQLGEDIGAAFERGRAAGHAEAADRLEVLSLSTTGPARVALRLVILELRGA